jgi:hypothetical protein
MSYGDLFQVSHSNIKNIASKSLQLKIGLDIPINNKIELRTALINAERTFLS